VGTKFSRLTTKPMTALGDNGAEFSGCIKAGNIFAISITSRFYTGQGKRQHNKRTNTRGCCDDKYPYNILQHMP
jgi:hypothetical protein